MGLLPAINILAASAWGQLPAQAVIPAWHTGAHGAARSSQGEGHGLAAPTLLFTEPQHGLGWKDLKDQFQPPAIASNTFH